MGAELIQNVTSATRNSPLRERSAGVIQYVVDRLHTALPGLTPNHLSLFSAIGVASASALLTLRKRGASFRDKALTLGSLTFMVGSTLLDGLDGTLARTMEAETPRSMNPEIGQLFDVLADQTGGKAMAFSRAHQAHQRHDRLGVTLALIQAVASSLPSLTRAFDEMGGHKGPEMPPGLFGLAGTHFGRTAIGIASTVFPEIHRLPVQVISDGVVIISSIHTAANRLKIGQSKDPATLPAEIRKQAKTRFKALAIFTGLSLVATGITYLHLSHKRKN